MIHRCFFLSAVKIEIIYKCFDESDEGWKFIQTEDIDARKRWLIP